MKKAIWVLLMALGDETFRETPALREVVMPEGLETIGTEAFFRSGIEKVTLPESLVSVGLRAFASSSLKEIAFRASVAKMRSQMFEYGE